LHKLTQNVIREAINFLEDNIEENPKGYDYGDYVLDAIPKVYYIKKTLISCTLRHLQKTLLT
jgi:hypothetical protein